MPISLAPDIGLLSCSTYSSLSTAMILHSDSEQDIKSDSFLLSADPPIVRVALGAWPDFCALKKLVFQLNFLATVLYSGRKVGRDPAVMARLISTSDQIAIGTVANRNSGSLKVGT